MKLNYGQLPTRQYFRIRYALTFKEEALEKGQLISSEEALKRTFEISHGALSRAPGDGVRPDPWHYTVDELWAELNRLVDIFDGRTPGFTMPQQDEAGSWASDILSTLGIEWI